MGDFFAVITACITALKIQFTIYGFTFSYWDVMLFTIFVPIVIGFILALRK